MKNYITIFFLLCSIYSFGQFNSSNNQDFKQQKEKQEQFYSNRNKGKGTGYKVFKRWEDFVQNHLDTNQRIINNTAMAFDALNRMKKRGELNQSRSNSNWTELGPDDWTNNNPDPFPDTDQGGWLPGNGRVNEIAIDPNNDLVLYAGASGGGLWKSVDDGNNWTTLTDDLPNLAVSGIAISHTNSDHIYMLTGDLDSRALVSIGVLKSTDGGSNWVETGLSFDRDEVVYGSELKMDYNNSSKLVATTSEGIYYTNNSGDSWDHVQFGEFFDIVYHPTNPDTVYASTAISIFQSSDGGQNWIALANMSSYTLSDSRIELAVTPANTDKIYAILGDKDRYEGLFFSEDRGDNWLFFSGVGGPNILASDTSGSFLSTQATFDLCIAVSPINENEIVVGGINVWKSMNGGSTWDRMTYWRHDWADGEYIHSDIHELIFSGTKLYAGTDGGIYKSNDYAVNWVDLSEGLGIMQPHKIGITNANTNLVYVGAQDNGVNKYSGNSTFEHVRGADGFECIIMPTNSDTVFSSRQYGIVELSSDGGSTFSVIISDVNNKLFNNPLQLKPGSNDQLITSKAGEIIITNLAGNIDFTKLIPGNLHYITNIDISIADVDLLAVTTYGRNDINTNAAVWLTTTLFDAAQNQWVNITGTLPVTRYCISDIVIDPYDNQHIIVSFNGYADGNKIFETWNRGTNWVNTSYNLENVPVNCIVVDPDIPKSVYIGTDLGVFYKEPDTQTWIYYNNDLPAVMVHELEINSVDNLIYAATYGRGLWRSNLFDNCTDSYVLTPDNDPGTTDISGIQHYETSFSIESTRQVVGGFGTNVHYQAGNFIDLTPGFKVIEGSAFRSVVGGCGEVVNSPFLGDPTSFVNHDDN